MGLHVAVRLSNADAEVLVELAAVGLSQAEWLTPEKRMEVRKLLEDMQRGVRDEHANADCPGGQIGQ